MTPAAAMEVLLGLLFVHVVIVMQAEVVVYRLMCNHQWNPKSTNCGHTKKSWGMKREPFILMGTDKMIPRYVYDQCM
jgi:hypothetical protein